MPPQNNLKQTATNIGELCLKLQKQLDTLDKLVQKHLKHCWTYYMLASDDSIGNPDMYADNAYLNLKLAIDSVGSSYSLPQTREAVRSVKYNADCYIVLVCNEYILDADSDKPLPESCVRRISKSLLQKIDQAMSHVELSFELFNAAILSYASMNVEQPSKSIKSNRRNSIATSNRKR